MPRNRPGLAPIKLLVTGSRGLIGGALVPSLTTAGHSVTRLVHAKSRSGRGERAWSPAEGLLDAKDLQGQDAVVHLAGESISSGRWTTDLKARILDSRVQGTRLLSETLGRLARPPKILLCASAIGYYGDRGEEVLTEESARGEGFLADVCAAWEAAAKRARDKGIRVVHLRFGVVLSTAGGALQRMLGPFRLGVGGKLGGGGQFMSWISLDDAVGAIHHALSTDALRGPVNVVSPHPCTNQAFTKTLGKVLRRPTFLSVPDTALRMALGEMAEALLLASTRVRPCRLEETGYRFRHPELEGALRHLLGR